MIKMFIFESVEENQLNNSGKIFLVTAAAQGMGHGAAVALAESGGRVIATDRDAVRLAKLDQVHPGIETHVLDVTDGADITGLAAQLPPLDGLFNCAGIVQTDTVADMTDENWALNLDVNLTSMMRMCRAFLPGMLARAEETGSVAILNMSSMASSIKGFVGRTSYGTTKAGVIGLTKAIAADYVAQGIRCNALCPGTIDTPSLQGRINSAADPVQARKDFIARQPMGRLGRVEDMVPMIVHLLSDESRFTTGQAISVDGGCTI